MYGKNFSKFTKYHNLNEISKFSNFNNISFLSKVANVSVGLNLDLSLEKSKTAYYSKGLLGFFLIYLITNKYPKIKSSKDQRLIWIESNLTSTNLICFLEKFFIIYDSKKREYIIRQSVLKKGFIRFLVTDLNIFSELDSFIPFFRPVEYIYIDIMCHHEEDSRNSIYLDSIFKSSYLI